MHVYTYSEYGYWSYWYTYCNMQLNNIIAIAIRASMGVHVYVHVYSSLAHVSLESMCYPVHV